MADPADRRSNPSEKNGVVGITASSAALVIAQQEADFAVTSDHLGGARVRASGSAHPHTTAYSAPSTIWPVLLWPGYCMTAVLSKREISW